MLSRHRLQEAQLDHATFYLMRLQTIAQADSSAQHEIELDLQQIQQAQAWSASYSPHSPQAAEICSAFGQIDTTLLEHYQDGTTQIQWYTDGVHAATLLADVHAQQICLYHLAMSQNRLGRYADVLQTLQQIIDTMGTHPLPDLLHARLLICAGDTHEKMGEAQQALGFYHTGLTLSPPMSIEHAHAHCGLARAYTVLNQHDLARQHYRHCLNLYQAFNQPARLAQVYVGMGELAYNQGDYATAQHHLEHAIAIAEPINHLRSLTMAHRTLGYLADDRGEHNSAEYHLERSSAYCQRLGDLREHAIILGGLGMLHWRAGKINLAHDAFERSIAACRQTGDQIGIAYMLINLSQITAHTGDRAHARTQLQQAHDILTQLGDEWGQAKAQMSLGELDYQEQNYHTAHQHFLAALQSVEALSDTRGQAIACINLGYTAHALNHPDAADYFKRGLAIAQRFDYPPIALDAVLGLANLFSTNRQALETSCLLLGFLLDQPQLSSESATKAQTLLQTLKTKVPPHVMSQALTVGKGLQLSQLNLNFNPPD